MAKKKASSVAKSTFMSEEEYRSLSTRMRDIAERGRDMEAVILSLARAGNLRDVEADILRMRRYRVRFNTSAEA